MPTTTNYALRYPASTDPADVPTDMQHLAADVDAALGGKRTTSLMSGGPPGSPHDGDIWIAANVNTVGTRWAFQYSAGSSSAYKWEFIGGGPVYNSGDPNTVANAMSQVAATGYYYNITAMTAIVARAGDYLIRGHSIVDANGGSPGGFNVAVFAGSVIVAGQAGGLNSVNSQFEGRSVEGVATGVAASTTVGVALAPVAAGTNKIRSSSMSLIPIRIS